MTKTGRPTRCTPETTAKVCKALRLGSSIRVACKYARISESMYHRWYADGTREDEASAPYRVFREAVDDADSDFSLGLQTTLMKAAIKDAKLALEVLARRQPEDWGRTHKLEHSGPAGGPIEIEDARARLLARLAAVAAARAAGGGDRGPTG